MNREGDFHKDVLLDLLLRSQHMKTLQHLEDTKCPGFIQELSLEPFYVSLYRRKQLDLLHRYLSYNQAGCLHLDATGKVTARLPENLGVKDSFYYALVIHIGETEAPCVPVMEFITNQHSAFNLSHPLHYFFRRFEIYLN